MDLQRPCAPVKSYKVTKLKGVSATSMAMFKTTFLHGEVLETYLNQSKAPQYFSPAKENKTDFEGQILQDGTASMQSRLNLKHFLRKGSQKSVS